MNPETLSPHTIKTAWRDLQTVFDYLHNTMTDGGGDGLAGDPESYFSTMADPDAAFGMLDDLEARCDVDVTETRAALADWHRDYCKADGTPEEARQRFEALHAAWEADGCFAWLRGFYRLLSCNYE